jgi:hypothetical protein
MSPMISMVATDNWMEYTIRYLVAYRERRTTQDRIFTRVLEEFGRTDDRVALGSATSQIIQPSSIDVVISRKKEQAEHDGKTK